MPNTIISQVQARNALFDFEAMSAPTITDFKEDPLVLAACLYRLMQDEVTLYFSLADDRLLELITDEDKELAEQIRKYYTKKFFWANFTTGVSSFRSRLLVLLETKTMSCSDQDCGIYYKIPWFYKEDMAYEKFKKTYKTTDIPKVFYGLKAQKSLLNLKFLESTVCRQRKRKIERFWFTDSTHLFCVQVEQENPLLDMFKHYVSNNDVTIESYKAQDRIDDMEFYRLYKFNFTQLK